MKINPLLTGRGNMVALIKEANPGFTLLPTQIQIVDIAIHAPTGPVPYNTQAVVMGASENIAYGTPTVYYDRRPMNEAVETPTTFYPITVTTTWDDLLGWVATELKLVKSEVEFVNFHTAQGSTVSLVTLQPIANSQIYVPGGFDLTLAWSGPGVEKLLPYLYGASELHKFLHVILPAPGYL